MWSSIGRRIIVVAVLAISGFALCAHGMAQEAIKVGVIFSLTGPVSGLAKLQQEGALLAFKEINDAGGVKIGGKMVKLEPVLADDKAKASEAQKHAYAMINEQGVKAIVGGSLAHCGAAIGNEVKASNTFYMSTCLVPDSFFTKVGRAPTAVSVAGAASDLGRALASYTGRKIKPKKVACFLPSYAFGEAIGAGFKQVMAKYPDITYQVFWHPLAAADIKANLRPVQEYQPDLIILGGWGNDAVNELKAIHELGLAAKARIFHGWFTNSFAAALPPEALQGVNLQMFWYYDPTGVKDETAVKNTKNFVQKYRKEGKEAPDPYALIAYSGVKEAARALQLAGSTNGMKMAEALMTNPKWAGPKGDATWRGDGRCMYQHYSWILEGKGPSERKAGDFDSKFDFAKVVDIFTGEEFAPPLKDLGY